ncbi:uncharacterized protein LOC127722640 [Mytilus californianus]|uniref:uncharacterized protein LOC127722640 n=1 Tax=Mytilus californianus TaxID=6549 RepID=UPI00224754E2|nr:uncharacterized protein LOC127722640 [Mytilus californianus]XP_052085294.1 uncharacterized protein LOC127722640 [Mytilus californianus]
MKKLKQIKHELHTALCCGTFSSVNGPLSKEEKARRRHLKKNKPFKVSDVRRTPFTISFTMTLPDGTSMPVDLIIVPNLPKGGMDGNFTKEDLTNIYQQMKANPEQRDYYAKCLSPVQVSFVKNQPEKVKRAIRVTKDWAKSNEHKLPSYAIELLAIKTYEDFNRPEPGGITEEKIVNGIFEQLKDCKNMKVEWDTNHNLDDYGRPDGPYIMDPANPYHNLFRPKTEEYWINCNESERVILSEPDISRIESDAAIALESMH